jgi:hypothetical protein
MRRMAFHAYTFLHFEGWHIRLLSLHLVEAGISDSYFPSWWRLAYQIHTSLHVGGWHFRFILHFIVEAGISDSYLSSC